MENLRLCKQCNLEKFFDCFYFKHGKPSYKCKKCIRDNNLVKDYYTYENLKGEIFKDIVGYENIYQISTLGNVKSLFREFTTKNNSNVIIRERVMKNNIAKIGYNMIALCKNNKSFSKYIHRLVALHFIPNPDNKPEVNHIDGNKLNNNIENLEWVTGKENVNHAMFIGLSNHAKGENQGLSKLTKSDVLEIRTLIKTMTTAEIAVKYKFSQNGIKSIITIRTWKHI